MQKMKKKINNAVLSFLVSYVVVLQVFVGQGIETFFSLFTKELKLIYFVIYISTTNNGTNHFFNLDLQLPHLQQKYYDVGIVTFFSQDRNHSHHDVTSLFIL